LLLALLLAGGGVAAYLLTRPAKRVVPPVTGQQLNTARTNLQNAGFSVTPLYVASNQPSQTVIGENPTGGSKADEGSTVSLTVSSGPSSVNVPTVLGDPVAQATKVLLKQGLKRGPTLKESSDQIPTGAVIDTNPAAGQTVPAGTAVTLIVSTGKAKVTVPDVTGQPQAQAKSTLQAAGFQVTSSSQTSTAVPAGNVISQSPSGNSQTAPGSTVTLAIAQAPTTAAVPNVKGQTAAAATSQLQAAGFHVAQGTKKVSNQSKNGTVLSQSPGAGKSAKKGSTVTIVVGRYSSPTPTTTTPTTPTTTTPTTTTP
jgi:serine/threonine-protein kinase